MPASANSETQVLELMQNSLRIEGPFTLELLSGGLSGSEVIKVNTPDKTYVVRLWNKQWMDYFPQDLACQLIASEVGYGPKVYFADEVNAITIMEYHFPETLPEIQTRLQALVALLKKIHAGPAVPKGIDRAVYLDLLIEEVKATPFFDLEMMRTIKDTVFAATRINASYVPCHRDLHHGNLIFTHGKFLALDYTWGAMDDPYADLANIAIFNCKTFDEEQLLLQLYSGHAPSPKETARLSLMKLTIKLFYGLEFLGVASTSLINTLPATPSILKSYITFGCNGDTVPSHAELLNYAISLLNEVVEYACSELYVKDLALVQEI